MGKYHRKRRAEWAVEWLDSPFQLAWEAAVAASPEVLERPPRSLEEARGLSAAQLALCDIALLNLHCAVGLPNGPRADLDEYLDWLEEAAECAAARTQSQWGYFRRAPGDFKNSLAFFCCHWMLQALQEDFGVRYNPARITDTSFQDPKCHNPDFSDSRDLFIHGIIDGPGGCCASMPVLYVAVGRRLGYPLKLAEARGHLFFRWDDPEGKTFGIPERINFEGTGHGISAYADDHYAHWPQPLRETDKRGGWYLKSLEPNEELAGFLGTRGQCLSCVGRLQEAVRSYSWARDMSPNDGRYHDALLHALRARDRADLQAHRRLAGGARSDARGRAAPPVGRPAGEGRPGAGSGERGGRPALPQLPVRSLPATANGAARTTIRPRAGVCLLSLQLVETT